MASISDLLREELIITSLSSCDKAGVIREFSELLMRAGRVKSAHEVEEILIKRESLGSTGIGDGVAIPHGKMGGIADLILAFGISGDGVEFNALDGKPSHIFFLLIAPDDAPSEHLKALARISRILKSAAFRDELVRLETPSSILARIAFEEEGLR